MDWFGQYIWKSAGFKPQNYCFYWDAFVKQGHTDDIVEICFEINRVVFMKGNVGFLYGLYPVKCIDGNRIIFVVISQYKPSVIILFDEVWMDYSVMLFSLETAIMNMERLMMYGHVNHF